MSTPLSTTCDKGKRKFRKQPFEIVQLSPTNYGQIGLIIRSPTRTTPRRISESLDGSYTPSMRGRLCPSLTSNGICDDIRHCPFSHTVEEARSFNPNFKTKICEFAANGFCEKANLCRYAHSFSELAPVGNDSQDVFPCVGRNVSSVSTIDPGTHSFDCGSDDDSIPYISSPRECSPITRVCYEAPAKQRSVIPMHRQKQQRFSKPPRVITVPSAYHYIEQLERLRAASSLTYPYIPASYAAHPQVVPFGLPGSYFPSNQPMMYSMMSPNVVYED